VISGIERFITPSLTVRMPSFPPIFTSASLASLRLHSSLPKHSWYLIAATTLSIINRPDEVPKVYEYALDNGVSGNDSAPGHDERLKISRRMREALIKASTIGGVPRVCSEEFFTLFNLTHS
jgi:hypothetical protein